MFTVAEIEQAHQQVKSGADFPAYIQEIKQMGVVAFETWVSDSHTTYYGKDVFQTASAPQYEKLFIAGDSDPSKFHSYLKTHQKGETDYYTFCTHCAETGIEKWIVCLYQMTCTYYDRSGTAVLVEQIPE